MHRITILVYTHSLIGAVTTLVIVIKTMRTGVARDGISLGQLLFKNVVPYRVEWMRQHERLIVQRT
jgi:hypothetical protein